MHDPILLHQIILDLLIILTAGLAAGIVCKRLRIPMVVGYLLVGALIGQGMFGLITSAPPAAENHLEESEPPALLEEASTEAQHDEKRPELSISATPAAETTPSESEAEKQEARHRIFRGEVLENLAHLGALLLLFSIGIHFSPSELSRMWRFFSIGGIVQMTGVLVPVLLFFHFFSEGGWRLGFLVGSAAALSSTVLVFKALDEFGQSTSPHGQRAVGILLFQDVAIVPLMLVIPLLGLTSASAAETGSALLLLLLKSLVFLLFVVLLRYLFCRWAVRLLIKLRSVELLVLFTIMLLTGVCEIAYGLGLSSALGALATGVILSENRMSHQISAITIPFRESFAAIFFVSLGALLKFDVLFASPLTTLGAMCLLLALKTLAAAAAFKLLRLTWGAAFAMGLGLSQLGELSFILLSVGLGTGMLEEVVYQRMLFIALSSLILTPFFLKVAMNVATKQTTIQPAMPGSQITEPIDEGTHDKSLIVGVGPIGGRVASFLEISGLDVCLVDMNPVNLHPYAQQGFRTVSGNACDTEILRHADVEQCTLTVVTIPDDLIALQVVAEVRKNNPHCVIIVRCRYTTSMRKIRQAGANHVISEESEAGGSIIKALENIL
jgi:CPA2 family monovalent cation:H+ antiporter-2